MAASLFEHGAIRTTVVKAKELKPFVERLITIAREGTLHARRRIIALLGDRAMVDKENPDRLADQTVVQLLFSEIAPRYVDRPGGYTRIIHLPERRIGDGSKQVLLQLVEATATTGDDEDTATVSRRRRRAAQRADHARSVVEDETAAEEADDPVDTQEAEDGQGEAEAGDEADEAASADDEDDKEKASE